MIRSGGETTGDGRPQREQYMVGFCLFMVPFFFKPAKVSKSESCFGGNSHPDASSGDKNASVESSA